MTETPEQEKSPQLQAYEHIRELAKSRLIEQEAYLRQKNIRTRCGVEIEFFVNDTSGVPQKIRKNDFKAIEEKLKTSRYVERFYEESAQHNRAPVVLAAFGAILSAVEGDVCGMLPWGLAGGLTGMGIQRFLNGSMTKIAQYEFVVGDRLGDDTGKHRMGCFKAAVAAEHMKYVVTEELAKIGKVTYQAKPRADKVVSGMHINVSLLDAKGENLFADENNGLLKASTDHLVALQKDAALLFLPDEASLERLTHGRSSPKQFAAGTNKMNVGFLNPKTPSVEVRKPSILSDLIHMRRTKPKHTRIENKLPAADADPYLGMVVSMGALVNAVDGVPAHAEKAANAVDGVPAHAEKAALERGFEGHKTAFKQSKTLESVLGSELNAAIRDYVDRYGSLSAPKELEVDPLSKALYAAKNASPTSLR